MSAGPVRRDWVAWHADYDDPASELSARLRLVQECLAGALDAAPLGGIRLVSACAGQGRDVLGVLPGHPRRDDVTARLVELDPRNAAVARATAAAVGLTRVEVIEGDAGAAASYTGAVPAHVVCLCGVFGHVDVPTAVSNAPLLCAPGASVLWTRRGGPERLAEVRAAFDRAGFEEVRCEGAGGTDRQVGWHRLAVDAPPFDPAARLFTFAG